MVVAAFAATVTSLTLVATASAANPPDETGKKYSDAKADLSKAGFTPVVGGSVGDEVGQSDCIVVGQNATITTPFAGGGWPGSNAKQTVRVSLDCTAQKQKEYQQQHQQQQQ